MQSLFKQLETTKVAFDEAVAACETEADLETVRVRFLGKKGELTNVLRGMKDLKPEERPAAGSRSNELRRDMEQTLRQTREILHAKELEAKLKAETMDITLPGHAPSPGARHPLTRVTDDIVNIFIGLGFSVAEGPEIEFVRYNFDWLEIPETHPSRELSDTFYVSDDMILRTQTSPVQVRSMLASEPPLRIVCPGRVYRPDTPDATHSPIFHQIEGLAVDKGVTMSDLVGCLKLFAQAMFGENSDIRLRPHHFPFTEPSCEVDITCPTCGGNHAATCRMCRGEGFIEVLGAGMVHPDVLRNGGIDPDVYSGFAFGIGVERTAMGRYGIRDIRDFYENDLRFLKPFKAQ